MSDDLDPARCVKRVYKGAFVRNFQCKRRRGYGPNGQFCKLHSPESVAARARKREQQWEARNAAFRQPFEKLEHLRTQRDRLLETCDQAIACLQGECPETARRVLLAASIAAKEDK